MAYVWGWVIPGWMHNALLGDEDAMNTQMILNVENPGSQSSKRRKF
jgi:hypothetical protein